MFFKTFYRISLSLPIFIPVLTWSVVSSCEGTSGGVAFICFVSLTSLLFGGVQYFVFSVVAFWLIGRVESVIKLKRLVWLSPLIFSVFAVSGFYIYGIVNNMSNPGSFSLSEAIQIWIPVLLVNIPLGYGYCFITEIVYFLLKKYNLISLEQAQRA